MNLRIKYIISFIALVLLGCATQREITPNIESPIRNDLRLKVPVQASVFDGRTNGNNIKAETILQNELQKIYGTNLEWVPYFQNTAKGRLSIKYRIINLGSTFGSRIISSATYATAVSQYQLTVPNAWNQVFVNGTSSTSIQSASFSGSGWWNGAAWVDVEIDDNRLNKHSKFVIPLAAEHQESNLWGYSSGDKAALIAWQSVAAQVTRITDAILISVRDDNN